MISPKLGFFICAYFILIDDKEYLSIALLILKTVLNILLTQFTGTTPSLKPLYTLNQITIELTSLNSETIYVPGLTKKSALSPISCQWSHCLHITIFHRN